MGEEQDEISVLRKERNMAELRIRIKIVQVIALLVFVFSLPVTAPMFGADQKDLKEMNRIAVPVTVLATPVGLYRIVEAYLDKKECQEKMEEIERSKGKENSGQEE